MSLTNRKQKRIADKNGLLQESTGLINLVTGNKADALVIWKKDFTPTLIFMENNKIVYECNAIEFMEHLAKLTKNAINNLNKKSKEPQFSGIYSSTTETRSV